MPAKKKEIRRRFNCKQQGEALKKILKAVRKKTDQYRAIRTLLDDGWRN